MKRRTGFTIVELLVSLALIVLIMAVMSEAFVSALGSVSHLKATGDMQERLRVGATPLRREILSRHFDNDDKISTLQERPEAGFFRIVQIGAFATEGTDGDGIPSIRSNGLGSMLHFTVRKPIANSGRREDFFSARVPNGSGAQTVTPTALQQNGLALGDAIEVMYFLRPINGEVAGNYPGGVQLYSLHRRQKVVHYRAPELNQAPYIVASGQLSQYGESACAVSGGSLKFMSLTDLTTSTNRTVTNVAAGFSGDNTVIGDDLVMADVSSFTVEVLRRDTFDFVPISTFCPQIAPNIWEYDTSSSNAIFVDANTQKIIKSTYNLKGIKITLRIWDFKSQMSRQITVIEEL